MNIKTKRPTVKSTNKSFETLLNHLNEFQKIYNTKIDFDTIDFDFYNEYDVKVSYLNKIIFYMDI